MGDTETKKYLAYDKCKRKFFSIEEVELNSRDIEIYEFNEQNFRLVTN